LALHKSRRDDHEAPENFVLAEETDGAGHSGSSGGNSSKSNSSKRQRRILEPKENVYLAQLTWKGGARLVLEEKNRIALHPMFDSASHPNVCETQSDPVGGPNRLMPGNLLLTFSSDVSSTIFFINRRLYGFQNVSESETSFKKHRFQRSKAFQVLNFNLANEKYLRFLISLQKFVRRLCHKFRVSVQLLSFNNFET